MNLVASMRKFLHIKFRFLSILVLFFTHFASTNAQTKPEVLRLSDLDSIQSLDTGFTSNQNPHVWYLSRTEIDPKQFLPKSGSSDGSDLPPGEGWEIVKVPGLVVPDSTNSSKSIWYYKKFIAPETSKTLSLRLGTIEDRDVAYLNGVKIGETGNWDQYSPQSYDKIRIYDIPENLLRKGSENILLIRVQGYFDESIGIVSDTTQIGPSWTVHSQLYLSQIRDLIFLSIYATVGAYFLFLYIRRRREHENLFFSLFVISLVVYQFLRTQIKYELNTSFLTLKRVEYAVLISLVPYFYLFIRNYFTFPKNKFMKGLDIAIIIPFVLTFGAFAFVIFTDNAKKWDSINLTLVQPLYIPFLFTVIGFLIYRTIKKDKDAILMIFGLIAVVVAMIIDILSTRHIIIMPRLMGYAFMAFILTIATILANKFVRLNETVEDLNKNLEKKVEERTEELNKTLNEVQALKVQQDGDYFLTSLLLRPLSNTKIVSNNIIVESFIKQKKNFVFQNKNMEIGGDINIAHNVKLQNRDFVLFLNGDAMGKSIQGAGGALVLGTVFQSIVDRTIVSPREQDLYPERWLKNTFIEMHKVFSSFDGSMLMSITMGLMDSVTGTVYYINAEHPYSILYRDGKASFLETDVDLRKLGTTLTFSSIQVTVTKLEPGDSLILGSDGRDDLLLGMDEQGQRIINEDETKILKTIESSEGDIKKTAESLKKQGEITDDLSLLKITFKSRDLPPFDSNKEEVLLSKITSGEDSLNLLKAGVLEHPGSHRIAKLYFELSKKNNKIDHIQSSSVAYFALFPDDSDSIRDLADQLSSINATDEALDFAERYRLRYPNHNENLNLLIQLYNKKGRKDQVEVYTKKLRALQSK
jgi:drug/metabolite transporter superfamily protein YnfA